MSTTVMDDLAVLLYATPPARYCEEAREWRDGAMTEAVAEQAMDVGSVLGDWWLTNRGIHGDAALAREELAEDCAEAARLLRERGREDLAEAVEGEVASVAASNLARLTRMTLAGETNTYWGNDYASHLEQAMRRGACLVTTNPVLVNVARKEDPDHWTPVRDRLRAEHPGYGPAELAYAITIEVVVANARLLRPLWELTSGRIGYVSLQLSPKQAGDAEAMVREARWVWERLGAELGGTPNTVFKLPATRAGLDACCAVTAEGMGVNITVNFALPQQIAFAGAIEAHSTAPVSFRTQMDGRLDDPVGDELAAAGVDDWQEVKTWCTTAIRQREYRLLSQGPREGGLGLRKAYPLPASGRGPWNILRSVNDGPVPLFITIFPDRQAEFDAERREIDPRGMWTPLPDGHLEKLRRSRLFRMAYEPDGMAVADFDTFLPVVRTLEQFAQGYDEMVAWVAGEA
jgi:hypothetical protein